MTGDTQPKFPVTNLWDRNPSSEWRGTDANPTFSVSFEQPIDLMFLIVHNGSPGDAFVANRRPSKIEVVFPDKSSKVIDLEDKHEIQSFEVSANGIDELTIKVLETNGPKDAPISVSEFEFNMKS